MMCGKGDALARQKPPVSQNHTSTITPQKAVTRLQRSLDQIDDIKKAGRKSPEFETWSTDVQGVLADFYGRSSLKFEQFDNIRFFPGVFHPGQPEQLFVRAFNEGIEVARGFLKSRIAEISEDINGEGSPPLVTPVVGGNEHNKRKVFVVHGHDHGTKETVARYISKLGLEPIILHEQPDKGRTIIEKFEDYADVSCAVVILSPDDEGRSKSTTSAMLDRARQNVIFEMGFFIGRLGRHRTFSLLMKGVTKPSDLDGVLYIPMESSEDDGWRLLLLRELKAAGMEIDANKAFS
jgi:predicted nucleotide-binding protein